MKSVHHKLALKDHLDKVAKEDKYRTEEIFVDVSVVYLVLPDQAKSRFMINMA